MNLTIDIGNTAAKWAAFEGRTLVDHATGMPGDALVAGAGRVMVCASGEAEKEIGRIASLNPQLTALHSDTPLPLRLDYKTPQSLGPDRIAAACGAWSLHRGEASVVVDAGTCITVDFVGADGVYHGGAIMPGLGMQLRALHEQTARLPLVSLEGVDHAPVLGRSTEESILAGTLGATMLALAGYVALYRERCKSLRVMLTGGDAHHLATSAGWELQPRLTMIGMNEILLFAQDYE